MAKFGFVGSKFTRKRHIGIFWLKIANFTLFSQKLPKSPFLVQKSPNCQKKTLPYWRFFKIHQIVLNQDRIIDDGYECPHCKRFLPRFEMTERLVDSISALPIYLRTRDHRRQIQFGNDITIHSLNNGPIEFTMIGCIQFTGILN